MDQFVGHVVRRGVEAHSQWRSASAGDDAPPAYQMPAWGVATITSTIILMILSLSLIEYTYGNLIGTLLMIESPTAVLFEPLAKDDPDAPLQDSKNVEAELLLIKQQPITSKFRTAIKHLRERAGVWSRFRGLSIFIVYSFLFSSLASWLKVIPFVSKPVAAILAATLLARVRMGWTHIVISDPSPKYWFRRLPSLKLWKKVAIPTAVLAASQQITFVLPHTLSCYFGLMKFKDPQAVANLDDAERNVFIAKTFAVVLVAIFCAFALVIPANVTLTRVQASLLSEEEETIVPFDRSFGGRVVPSVVGGNGAVGMLDAWKTFDWNSRVRLLKLYVKIAAMELGLSLLFAAAIAVQLHLIMGEDLQKYLRPVQDKA